MVKSWPVRMMGLLWNSPNALLGRLLGTWSGAVGECKDGVVNYRMRHGIPLAVCRRLGISAFTVGDCVLYAVEPTPSLRIHEGRHVWQYRILGPFFLPAYFLLMPFYGYWHHPFERDARAHEKKVLGRVGPSRLGL